MGKYCFEAKTRIFFKLKSKYNKYVIEQPCLHYNCRFKSLNICVVIYRTETFNLEKIPNAKIFELHIHLIFSNTISLQKSHHLYHVASWARKF